MNLTDQQVNKGSTRVQYTNFVKESDASWALYNREPPTLVLEVGLSETVNNLAIDAHGWLEADGSETNVAITAKINRTAPQIIFEVWERDGRHFGLRSQTVEVSHNQGVRELTIPFAKVLCRPVRGGNERDFLFTKEELELIANEVWHR